MKALLGMCVVALVFAVGTRTAEAKIAIINTGDDIVEIGDVKPEALAELASETGTDVKIGMKYSRFGLFWLDIWRWNKTYVLFADVSYWEITEEQANQIAVSLDVPFTMTIPPGLIVILSLVLVAVLVSVLGRKKGDDDEAPPAGDEPEPAPAP